MLRAAVAAGLLSATRPGAADPTPSLALEPAPAGDRAFAVERAGVRGHLLFSARLVIDYARAPLVLVNPAQQADRVVTHQAFAHSLLSFSIAHRLMFHADVPVALVEAGDPAPAAGATATRAGNKPSFGDIRLGARVKLVGSADDAKVRTELALASSVWFPTATSGYAGDGVVRVRAALLLESMSQRFYWGFNGGVRTRPSEELPGALPTRVRTALSFGLAGGFFADAQREIALGTELVADLSLGGGARLFDPRATAAHLLLTALYRVQGGPFEVGASFGPGIGQGAGSADYRMLGLFGFAPERAAPPPDKDHDGVPDKLDACFDLPGEPSSDPLLHGCPKPPPDRDGDAIPDENDACPTVAGEPTGSRKTNGCPKQVALPTPKEPPEPKEPPTTKLVAKQIVLSQRVQFETGTAVLRPESDTVLTEVARVLTEHPEVELIEIQGHTDETGTPELNRKLGQDRAAAVAAWLVAHGIEKSRLSAKGYGADFPIADNTTDEGRTQNRRVEFFVLRTKPGAGEGAKP